MKGVDYQIFIDPVTGAPFMPYGYTWEGNFYDTGIASPILLDLKIDLGYAQENIEVNRLGIEDIITVRLPGIEQMVIDERQLSHNKIWRGDVDGWREESDDLTTAEGNITTLQGGLSTLEGVVTGVSSTLGIVQAAQVALEANLRVQDLVLTTASTLFPNAQVLMGKGAGMMHLDNAGIIDTRDMEVDDLPALDELNIFIGNEFGETVSRPIRNLEHLPDVQQYNLLIGDAHNRPEETQTIELRNLPDIEEHNVWIGDAGNRPQATRQIAVNNLPDLAQNSLWIGDNANHAQAVDPRNLPFGGGWLINASDADLHTARLQRSNVTVTQEGEVSAISVELRNNYGGKVVHKASQFAGSDTKYIWPRAENGKFLHSKDANGTLEWKAVVDTTQMPLVLNEAYPNHDKAQVLENLGQGMTKLVGSGRFALAQENTDYPSVDRVRTAEQDIRSNSTNIRTNSTNIRANSARLTQLDARVLALNGRVTVNTAQIQSLWGALWGVGAAGAVGGFFGALFGGKSKGSGGGGGNTYNNYGASYSWVINYVTSNFNGLKGSSSISINRQTGLDNYTKYTFSVDEAWLAEQMRIKFMPQGSDPNALPLGSNVVILN